VSLLRLDNNNHNARPSYPHSSLLQSHTTISTSDTTSLNVNWIAEAIKAQAAMSNSHDALEPIEDYPVDPASTNSIDNIEDNTPGNYPDGLLVGRDNLDYLFGDIPLNPSLLYSDITQTTSRDAPAHGTQVWEPFAQEGSLAQECLMASNVAMQTLA
jgi:hypothetical protein